MSSTTARRQRESVASRNGETRLLLPKLSPAQKRMLACDARVLHVAAGTKSGKTTAFAILAVQELLAGRRVAWVGPWYQRARAGFELVRELLSVPLARGDGKALDGLSKIELANGGRFDTLSGDNPEALYGGSYHLVILDEASRQSEKSLTAGVTTVSATGGRVRLASNVDRGAKNWAIRHYLRVRAMAPEERRAAGEECMTFPTLSEGFVSEDFVEKARGAMPEPLWRAFFFAEIPEDDAALFRDLDRIFVGRELADPERGRGYVLGVDLARKRDFTVATVLDRRSGAVVAFERFHEVSWSIQYERVADLYRRFRCSRALVDATGLGDPVAEEFRKRRMTVEAFIFTAQSKKSLIEGLILAVDKALISIPPTPTFAFYRSELDSFEYQLSESGEIRYGAPPGMHDDGPISLALAVRAANLGGSIGKFEVQTVRATTGMTRESGWERF